MVCAAPKVVAGAHSGIPSLLSLVPDKTILNGGISEIRRLAVSVLNESKDKFHVKAVNDALQKDGFLIVDLKFHDPESNYLLQLIHSLEEQYGHGPPLSHSPTRGWFLDVKPTPRGVARSEGTIDLPWHTDCSYDTHPPRFFALHVLQADRYKGGTLSILKVSEILGNLSEDTVKALRAPEFRILVPKEQAKGIDDIIGPLLKPAEDCLPAQVPQVCPLLGTNGNRTGPLRRKHIRETSQEIVSKQPRKFSDHGEKSLAPIQSKFGGGFLIRFRADIVEPLTLRASSALAELNRALAAAKAGNSCLQLTARDLPTGSVVLLDNGRWLHARNEMKDAERHMRRIRWDSTEF